MRALSVTVSSSVLSTCFVATEARQSTVFVHFDEVKCTVKTTWKVRHVYIKGELLILQVEHLIVRTICHKIDTGSNVGSSDELESKCVAGSSDTIGTGVIGAIKSTVSSAGYGIGAERCVP